MTLAFLESAVDADNPLYPVTPMRLAFFVRQALARAARPAGIATATVYEEVWARREELAERFEDGLDEYRREEADADAEESTWRVVEWTCGVVMGAAGLTLFAVGGSVASSWSRHERISLGMWVAGAVAGGLLFLAVPVRRLTWAAQHRIDRRRTRTYRKLITGDLTEEIAAMVDEILHRDDERLRGALLHQMRAPSLVEFGSTAVVRSGSFEEVQALIAGHVTSAVGVAGSRGAGKTTLLRLLCEGDPDLWRPEWIGVYLPAPMNPKESEFVKVIYGAVVRAVILRRGVPLPERGRVRVRRRSNSDVDWALATLDGITGSRSRQWVRKGGLARWGVSAELSGQVTWTERDLSRADWVEDFRGFVRGHRVRGGAPILIAVDELDKVADSEKAIEVINGIKDLFHIEGVHFVVSVSDDALRRFAARGIPVRDAFDTAFDTVIEVGRLRAEESYELLRQRARRFPYPAALFCHAWSGGLPRDLVRTARACITAQAHANAPIAVADLVHTIIRRDVTEVIDAAVRRRQDGGPGSRIEDLLALRRLLEDDAEPPHRQLAVRNPQEPGDDGLEASLEAFLDIATAISEYYSAPRTSEEWTAGIRSGEFLRHAELLAGAKAALAVHPSEAAWRLARAEERIGRSVSGGSGH
ncbi:KAP family NTPase [Actinoallomurus soli]|uniref:KAP family NTPase n=1 Tax=Actinoallomurus soli TaxID=2952535 RepID=UPI00209271AB|nr:KAP family NTPase [Actinoallomurus soli]MCO5970150.1 KAP family NTPase [Actinoallomurus soli]